MMLVAKRIEGELKRFHAGGTDGLQIIVSYMYNNNSLR
jgi:hypothetical protein